jgi:hypothetical protein
MWSKTLSETLRLFLEQFYDKNTCLLNAHYYQPLWSSSQSPLYISCALCSSR